MALALFDLDKTLLGGDSDFLWGEFLSEIGAVDVDEYQQQNQAFFDDYAKGELNIDKYLEFCLTPLASNPIKKLKAWHQQFMTEKIQPILLEKAQKVVNLHKKNGDRLIVITATNSFVTRPIAQVYGIDELLATEPEMIAGRFTGKVLGEPCFQSGKVHKLKQWCEANNEPLEGAYFYSDSHNDLPLLELVDNPIVVHADDKLYKIAKERDWLSLDWT
ncbi:HAD family hydrolase [bacterium endosymbiont of Bathymodiolus sp. 5 South]|jgi:HAD superfamily hydrolase (TIGR01490 family)|uniref:histidinol-phosphatase n=1 Tax=bacterium endosymbiont of Bathymodiolus sp. 5 South TaxID=1181670 RepID=UPI0010BC48A2|nr:HAD family hydrolase [bacterium endosymbiont of Bathymodiolus sp. 5 South]CAC9650638.1 Phosphoserine phosphatase (EC 3.1.3.3) [uncultured Gammaproteobacteria bacterium]SHN90745.1 Phosphoserine phosphatase [bacterium endosymbiont of Bathymodiolus sp. 5 South]SSC06974.1 Phosphoserine phosphatase [bacterium endosymbiont of Bathymodiolus sp. 5 South]VVH56479.1 Phosphoserine phosphatase (EC [uncultured Gammaproteobacteria bacterium]VVH63192.1 Phosphoserine phosphatase (EC [uncultured Gammaproteo